MIFQLLHVVLIAVRSVKSMNYDIKWILAKRVRNFCRRNGGIELSDSQFWGVPSNKNIANGM